MSSPYSRLTLGDSVQGVISLSPYIYWGHPEGGLTWDVDAYDKNDKSALQHLKISVAAPNGEDYLVRLDTLDLFCGVNHIEAAPPNYQHLNEAKTPDNNPLDGEAGLFEESYRGPVKGLPISFQRIHFYGLKEADCCDPKEYYAYFLVSKPVLVNSAVGCGKGSVKDDQTEQNNGAVEDWNDISYISDGSMPSATECNFQKRLIMGGTSSDSLFNGLDYWTHDDLDSPPACESEDFYSSFSFIAKIKGGEESESQDCMEDCDPKAKTREIDLEDISDAAIHLFYKRLKEAIGQSDETQLIYKIEVDGEELKYKAVKLSCDDSAYMPTVSFEVVEGTIAEFTNCSGTGI